MAHVASLKFQEEKLLGILCNGCFSISFYVRTMLPYKTAQNTLKTGLHCAQCGTYIYLKFESYNFQSNTWFIKVKGVDFYVQKVSKPSYEHL